MKNRKNLIRNTVFALFAVIALVIAYNIPQSAQKTEAPVSETKTEAVKNETGVSEAADAAQQAPEKAEQAAPEAEDAKLPSEDAQADKEAYQAAEPLTAESADEPPLSAPASSETPETAPEPETELYCTLSVRCDTVLLNMASLKDGKAGIVPQNGVIYGERRVKFNEGESVFNVLQREMKINKIHMEFVNAPMYGSAYIEGIGNLYEFDCGDLSGWMYKVNGVFPNYGCSQYKIANGDKIEWVYTCDLGKDVGGEEQPRNGRTNETE